MNNQEIPLNGRAIHIVGKCGASLTDVLESKFGCVVTIDGVNFEKDQWTAKRPHVNPVKRFDVKLPSGVSVSVWKADLTDLKVDAVVNAANEGLQHYGGLAQALSEAGGPQIQKDCDDYISKYGDLNTGDAIVTDAGLLQCGKIIHAVGPKLTKHPSPNEVFDAKPLLKKAIRSILDKAEKLNLKTVAIPAISSGLFNYPLHHCADTIVETIDQWYRTYSRRYPEELMLVNNDEPTVMAMERACRHILAPHLSHPLPTYSQATASKSRDDGKTLTVQMGNIQLTLKKGNIEEQKADVIVNSTSDRVLNSGNISKALLKKAGYGMQNEMYKAPSNGYVVITKGYDLHCKKVYHICFNTKGEYMTSQVLFKSVSECLSLAASKGHKTITFPAIGTGGLGFDKREAARAMLLAVVDFVKNKPKKMEINFVIFPSDNDTFQAFEERFRNLKQNETDFSSKHGAAEPREDFEGSRAPSPQIILMGPSVAAIFEAQKWLDNLFSKNLTDVVIRNNFIMHFGMKEHQQLSHLMENSVSIEERFDRGRASIAIRGSPDDVALAWMKVEAMLCKIRKEFVKEEEQAMSQMFSMNVSFERGILKPPSQEFEDRIVPFKRHPMLKIVKVDKVENATLLKLFESKKKQLDCSKSERMFQCIPLQFCEMVCRTGFQAEYAPPDEPKFGEGIYFTGTVRKALEVWHDPKKEYLHFVEAEVVMGDSARGKQGLILPPVDDDLNFQYHSVREPDVAVIFSGYQALPKYIITCENLRGGVSDFC